jgi:EAL domain-containing protein (putative c-di-GMP-specific phosphodiesterase class I)
MAAPLLAVALVLAAFGGGVELRVPALVPAMLAVGLAADVISFALLMKLYRGARPSPRLIGIAGCFVFSALLEIAFIVFYPRLLAPHGLPGGPADTVVWVWTAWHGGMILGLFGALGRSDAAWESVATSESAGPTWISAAFWAVALPVGLAAACVRAAQAAARLGPSSLHGSSYAGWGQVVPGAVLLIALLLAVPAARRMGTASSLEKWAMASALVATATMGLGVSAGSRYTLGWDGAWVLWAISEALLTLAIVYEVVSKVQVRQFRNDAQRRAITERLGLLDPSAPPEQVTQAICSELAHLPGVDFAQMVRLDVTREVTPTTACESDDSARHAALAFPLPHLRGRDLKARSMAGAFIERLDPADEGDGRVHRYLEHLREAGITAMAHAPIGLDERVSWVVSVGRTGDSDQAARDLSEVLPVLSDVAAVATILLAPTLRAAQDTAHARRDVETILARRSFRPVFQPVMTVDSKRIIGHEALTRFESGTSPDLVFATAAAVGLAVDLEMACIRAAVTEARGLDFTRTWLSLNVSPAVLLASSRALACIAAEADRPLVLELTEHVVIDHYGPVREALQQLRPSYRLAVDDVGSGFASLRHILELAPDFVKLDISLVRDIDQDPGRQAMVAGLAAFAQRAGCELIAEGVESAAELSELRSLGVTSAQGYLLGRPAPSTFRDPDQWIVRRSRRALRRPSAEVAPAVGLPSPPHNRSVQHTV